MPQVEKVSAEGGENAKTRMLKQIKVEHYVGIKKVHVDRLVQAEMTDYAARDRTEEHVNNIAQELITGFLMFQSPIQANVIVIPSIQGTQYKTLFTDIIFQNTVVKFTVFGHQHFFEAIKIARRHFERTGNKEMYLALSYVDVGIWIGLDLKKGKLLANIHNDVSHNIRRRDIWQLIYSLRLNYVSEGAPELSRGKFCKETQQLKERCFALENITSKAEINGYYVYWRIATFQKACYNLLVQLNQMSMKRELKGQKPLSKTQKEAKEFDPKKQKNTKSAFSKSQKVSYCISSSSMISLLFVCLLGIF